MSEDAPRGHEVPLTWFTKPLYKYTPIYAELLVIAICVRLLGLVGPFISQAIIDRIIPFRREASLILIVVIFVIVSL